MGMRKISGPGMLTGAAALSISQALIPQSTLTDTTYRDDLKRKTPKYRDTKAWNLEKNRTAAKAARKARRVARKHMK